MSRRRGGHDDHPDPLGPLLQHYDIDIVDRFGWQKIRCPFHDEDVPSCVVNIDQGGFSCFACGAKGRGPLAFIMQREQCERQQAEQVLREVYGDTAARPKGGDSAPRRVARGGYRPSFRKRTQSPLA